VQVSNVTTSEMVVFNHNGPFRYVNKETPLLETICVYNINVRLTERTLN
jgi:hypothetical protein